jgi:hypothetical protein
MSERIKSFIAVYLANVFGLVGVISLESGNSSILTERQTPLPETAFSVSYFEIDANQIIANMKSLAMEFAFPAYGRRRAAELSLITPFWSVSNSRRSI